VAFKNDFVRQLNILKKSKKQKEEGLETPKLK
jgi:hypothetical protein